MAKRKVAELESSGETRSSRRRKKTSEPESSRTSPPKARPSTNNSSMKRKSAASKEKPAAATESPNPESTTDDTHAVNEQQFWLMKAEPESRLENGHDVKFSIDDLAAKTEPEPWDGIRAYAARNNLRAMKKGDLAFFYHSNCKIPGIVGIMEIVQENSPDWSAQDPKAAYYDPKDTDASNPRWSVVHVRFQRKFKYSILLPELKSYAADGKELSAMQMLKQARLSVSKVSKKEWDFLMGVAEEKEKRNGE